MKQAFELFSQAKQHSAENALLLTQENGGIELEGDEKSYRLRQEDFVDQLPNYNREQLCRFTLPHGPYMIDYTRNGSIQLAAGRRGQLLLRNLKKQTTIADFNIGDTIRDVKMLQNETMIAVAQKNALYVYDNQGTEIHFLKSHIEPQKLEYLPYHYLLCSANDFGFLKYLDISTGKQIVEHRWRFEHVCDMRLNQWNAVVCVADAKGIVSMWAPNMSKPLIRLVCHNGPARCMAVDIRGTYMATGGADNRIKIWDIRKLSQTTYEYFTPSPPVSLDVSQNGLLSYAAGNEALVYKNWQVAREKPYMIHKATTNVSSVRFNPYEDFLGLGLADGLQTISIPGAGLANYDSYVANPFATKRQRQEHEVHSLLEKLRPDMITLNPHVAGTVDRASQEVKDAEFKEEQAQAEAEKRANQKKTKKKGNTDRVHDKKTRDRIKSMLKDKDRIAETDRVANEMSMLAEETADLGELVFTSKSRKKRKVSESQES